MAAGRISRVIRPLAEVNDQVKSSCGLCARIGWKSGSAITASRGRSGRSAMVMETGEPSAALRSTNCTTLRRIRSYEALR